MSRSASTPSSAERVARHDQQVQAMLHWLDGRLRGLPSEPREAAPPDVDVAAILRPQAEPSNPSRPSGKPSSVAAAAPLAAPQPPVLTRIAAYERSVLSQIQNRNARVSRP